MPDSKLFEAVTNLEPSTEFIKVDKMPPGIEDGAVALVSSSGIASVIKDVTPTGFRLVNKLYTAGRSEVIKGEVIIFLK